MNEITLELSWSRERHGQLLERLYKQLHGDPNLPLLSAVDCVALAMLSLTQRTSVFTRAAVLHYIEAYVFQHDGNLLTHIRGGRRFDDDSLNALINPVHDSLLVSDPLAAITWLNDQ